MKDPDHFSQHKPCRKFWLVVMALLLPIATTSKLLVEGQSAEPIFLQPSERTLVDNILVLQALRSYVLEAASDLTVNTKDCKETSDSVKQLASMNCPAQYIDDKFNLRMKLETQTDSAGVFFVTLEHPTPGEVHHAEFAIKVSVGFKTVDKKVTINAEASNSVKLSVSNEWAKIVQHLQISNMTELNDKLTALLNKYYTVTKELIKYSNRDLIWRKATIKLTSNPQIESFIETKIESDTLDSTFARVSLQLGAKFMSLKMPLRNFNENWSRFEAEIEIGLKSWFESKEDAFLEVAPHQVKESILKAVKEATKADVGQCYTDPVVKPGKSESDFSIEARLHSQDKLNGLSQCKVDPKKKILSDKYKITAIVYEFGSLHYAQLLLDNSLQTLESLIDLSSKTFELSISAEITQFFKTLLVDIKKEGTAEQLTIEEVLGKIQSLVPGVNCKANESKPKEHVCLKAGTPYVKVTETTHEGAAVYQVKFNYSKKPKEVPQGESNVMTNQIILQKFNAYDQMEIIEDMIKKFGEANNI